MTAGAEWDLGKETLEDLDGPAGGASPKRGAKGRPAGRPVPTEATAGAVKEVAEVDQPSAHDG